MIQTMSGTEQELKELIEHGTDSNVCRECIIPLCENVWRKGGVGHISIQRLFPGYVFVDTDNPKGLYDEQRQIQRFTRMLSMPEEKGEKTFIPVEPEEEAFLRSILEDGVMRVSFIRLGRTGRIENVKGPLEKYVSGIVKLDLPHRRAIVEKELFGKQRRIRFGLWTEGDPKLPRLDLQKGLEAGELKKMVTDIGIYPGDTVRDEAGLYPDMTMEVVSVDPLRRLINARALLFGTWVSITLGADKVVRV